MKVVKVVVKLGEKTIGFHEETFKTNTDLKIDNTNEGLLIISEAVKQKVGYTYETIGVFNRFEWVSWQKIE